MLKYGEKPFQQFFLIVLWCINHFLSSFLFLSLRLRSPHIPKQRFSEYVGSLRRRDDFSTHHSPAFPRRSKAALPPTGWSQTKNRFRLYTVTVVYLQFGRLTECREKATSPYTGAHIYLLCHSHEVYSRSRLIVKVTIYNMVFPHFYRKHFASCGQFLQHSAVHLHILRRPPFIWYVTINGADCRHSVLQNQRLYTVVYC